MQTTCRKKIHKTGNDIIERTPADTHECGLLNTFYDKGRFVQIVNFLSKILNEMYVFIYLFKKKGLLP